MKGGGVTFGPRNNRNFKKLMPKKMRRVALFSALSAKARANEIFVLDQYNAKEIKTKDFAKMVKALPIRFEALFVLPAHHEMLEKSAQNMPNVKAMLVNYLNIRDLRKYDRVVFLEESLKKMEEVFKEKKATSTKEKAKKVTVKK